MSRKSKILMLLDNTFVSDNRVEKEANSLIREGFEVTIFCVQADNLKAVDTRNGIRIIREMTNFFIHPFRFSNSYEKKRIIKRICTFNFDILHCHDNFMLDIGVGVKRVKPNIFLTYDSHEYLRGWSYYKDLKTYSLRLKGFLIWKFLLYRETNNLRYCNSLISASEEIGKLMVKHGNLNIQATTIRNIPTITKDESNESETDLRKRFNISADEFCLVQSGNIRQSTTLFFEMCNVISQLKNVRWVLINNKPISKTLALLVSQQKHLKPIIHFVEYDSKLLANYLESADFGMHFANDQYLTHYLATPNRVFEYSLSGIPFISTPQMLSESLNKDYGIVEFYQLDNPETFKSAIQRMIETLQVKKKNAQRIKYSLSWDTEFAPVVELYKKVALRLSN